MEYQRYGRRPRFPSPWNILWAPFRLWYVPPPLHEQYNHRDRSVPGSPLFLRRRRALSTDLIDPETVFIAGNRFSLRAQLLRNQPAIRINPRRIFIQIIIHGLRAFQYRNHSISAQNLNAPKRFRTAKLMIEQRFPLVLQICPTCRDDSVKPCGKLFRDHRAAPSGTQPRGMSILSQYRKGFPRTYGNPFLQIADGSICVKKYGSAHASFPVWNPDRSSQKCSANGAINTVAVSSSKDRRIFSVPTKYPME